MSTRNLISIVRPALGGLDITSDPTSLDANNLVIADNITYLEGGQRKRRPGFLQYSPSSSFAGSSTNNMVTSSSRVRALSDSWSYGASLTPIQRLISVTGASIFRSTGDGKWTPVSATSSFGNNTLQQTNIMLGQDHAVISDGVSTPIAYNLAATTLVSPTTGANWPIFESAVFHQARMVMLGLSTSNPSNIIFTAAGNIFDSTGVDSVTLPIDPGDGDRVVGAAQTFFGNLYVFKGPQFGSVHQISGNTSTEYVKAKLTRGAPALSHHGIITTPTDIFWISRYGIHSLQTTLKFGDVEQGFLSLPIQNLWRKQLIDLDDLQNSKGFWNPNRNIIGWFVRPAGQSGAGSRSWMIIYNYALSDPTPGGRKFWSIWKISQAATAKWGLCSAAMIINPSGGFQPATVGDPHLYVGGDNGMVYQGDYQYFDDDGTAYPVQITTPILTRMKTAAGTVPETQEKQFTGLVTFYNATDAQLPSSMTYSVVVDGRTAGTGQVAPDESGSVLGFLVLGLGILGGQSYVFEESIIEGRGRGVQVTWTNTSLDQDFEHLGYGLRFMAAEVEAKESV